MKQIIPFKKELPFKTKVSEITSISLEREISIEDDVITGVFHVTGDYKMNEGSINRENFSFNLPFDITLDPRYDIKTVVSDIEDFYYDVLNEDTLKVNIDLFVQAEYLKEEPLIEDVKSLDDDRNIIEEQQSNKNITTKEELQIIEEPTQINIETNLLEKENTREKNTYEEDVQNITSDLFSNLDNTETYTTYYVYIVKEDDTIDKILTKYSITKEELEAYNDITQIKPGDKVIVPKTSE